MWTLDLADLLSGFWIAWLFQLILEWNNSKEALHNGKHTINIFYRAPAQCSTIKFDIAQYTFSFKMNMLKVENEHNEILQIEWIVIENMKIEKMGLVFVFECQ